MTAIARLWRHFWWDADDARRVLDGAALDRLQQRVAQSERRHSGEVRICVEPRLPWAWLLRGAAPRERAIAMFGELRVWDTEFNNGVLVYLLLAEHAIEIVADRAVARLVPQAEWDRLAAAMGEAFRAGRFEDGLRQAIDAVDTHLTHHFPLTEGAANPNELPDRPHHA